MREKITSTFVMVKVNGLKGVKGSSIGQRM